MDTLAVDSQNQIEQADSIELIKSYDVTLTRWGLRIKKDGNKVGFYIGDDQLRISSDDIMVAQAIILSTSLHPKSKWVTAKTTAMRAEALLGLDGIGNDQIVATMHQIKNAIHKLGFGIDQVNIGRTTESVGNGVTERQTSIKIHDASHYTAADITKTLLLMGYEPEGIKRFLVF